MTEQYVSPSALQSMFARETDEPWLICLRISHPDLAQTYRIVDNTQPVVRTDGTYQPYSFAIHLPAQVEGQVPQVNILVDNIDLEVSRAIRNLVGRPKVEFEVVLASQPNVLEAGPYDFSLLNATVNALVITGTLGYEENVLNQAFPSEDDQYNPINSPGLYP